MRASLWSAMIGRQDKRDSNADRVRGASGIPGATFGLGPRARNSGPSMFGIEAHGSRLNPLATCLFHAFGAVRTMLETTDMRVWQY